MALFLQNGTPLLLQNGEELLLQSDNLAVLGPSNQSARDDDFVIFEVIVASNDPGSLTYQWYEDAVLIPLATDVTYTFIVAYPTDDQKTYYCEVTDSSGMVVSDTATLTVTKKILVWTEQPEATTVVEGIQASFSALAESGTVLPTYQWYETTQGILVGETATTLLLTPAITANGDSFYLEATDEYGDVWNSDTAILTVLAEQGLAKHDLRMKNPSGQWIEILNHDLWGPRHVDVASAQTPIDNDTMVYSAANGRWELASVVFGELGEILDVYKIVHEGISNTWTEAARVTVPAGTTWDFKIETTAKRQDTVVDFFSGWYGGVVTRNGGTASIIQNIETIMAKTTDNLTQFRVIMDGNDFVIETKQKINTNWDWKMLLKVRKLWEF